MMFFKCNQVFTFLFLLLLYFNNIVYTHVDDIKGTPQNKITYDKNNINIENINNEKNDNKDNINNNNNNNNDDEYKFLSMKNYKDSLSKKLNNEYAHINYLIRKRENNTQENQYLNNNDENSSIKNSKKKDNNIIISNEDYEEKISKKDDDLIEAFFPFLLKKLGNKSLSVDDKYDDYYNLSSTPSDTHKENSSDNNLLGYKLGNNLNSYVTEENGVSQTKNNDQHETLSSVSKDVHETASSVTEEVEETSSNGSEEVQEMLKMDSHAPHSEKRENQRDLTNQHISKGTNSLPNSQVNTSKGSEEKTTKPQTPIVNSVEKNVQVPKENDPHAEKIRRTLLKESRDIKNTTAIIDETVYKFEQLIMKGRYYATAVRNFVIFKVNYICEYSKCGANSRCYIIEKGKEQCRCRPNYIVDMSVNYFKCIPMKDMKCSENNGGCDINAECTIVEGAVKCQCNHLYFGDGVFCVMNSQTKQTLYILLIVLLLVFQKFFI
ncbi:merozoite surface protein 10 [Plasmodium gaboni]|uniref:Merozoite surface protein 10 n=1 Tax=Plasmodium gaboni TaxID=647221 RepID=A0A151LRT0_9APIC|nr:merozoite surface protein 10 [Plasmodium gaboni]KYO01898.1 merozoite surface protein 10 [Plasmodium gaboni]